MTKIVSAFPGVGKSHMFKHGGKGLRVLDSDSSSFSWQHLADGSKVRHPEFPNNYMKHIQSKIGAASLILVSAHAEVRAGLRDMGMDYALVYPAENLKAEYIDRYVRRGSPEPFVNLMDERWSAFIADAEQDPSPHKIVLGAGEYLADVIDRV